MQTAIIDLAAQGHMLCKLRISLRGLLGERRDKKASALVENTYGTKKKSTKASKMLLDHESPIIRAVKATAQAVHNTSYYWTFPWGDSDGTRFVPASVRTEFTAAMNKAIATHKAALADYELAYDSLVASAPHDLKELHNAAQYPSREEAMSRFECKLNWLPVPNSGHFVTELLGNEATAIKESFECEIRIATNTATNDLIDRVEKKVAYYVDRVANFAPGTETERAKSVFRDSLNDNMLELAGMVRKLNFLHDASIDGLAAQIERVARVSCEALREDKNLRAQIADEGQSLLDKLDSYRKTDSAIDAMIADVADYQ